MAKKPSLDTAKIKEFLFQKGERLGLGAAAGISLLLLVLAFVGITTRPPSATGAQTWSEAFAGLAKKTQQLISGSRPPEPGKGANQPIGVIPPPAIVRAGDFPPLVAFPPPESNKKTNPGILTVSNQINDDARDIQVDPMRAPTLAYDVNFQDQKIWAAGGQPVKYLEPKRMVIVTAAFPYQEQLKLFAEALQFNKIEDLLKNKDRDVPHFLGLNIWRSEVVPGAKEDQNLVQLYMYNPEKQQTVVHPPLDLFLRRMVIDSNNPAQLAGSLGPNMVTPLPFLASVTPDGAAYPKLKLTGFEQPEGTEDDAKPRATKSDTGSARMPAQPAAGNKGMPGDKGDGSPKPAPIFWSKLGDKELVERLKGNYNVFNPLGRPEGKEGKDNNAKKNDKDGPAVQLGLAVDDKAAELPKLLVRFIDIDLEMGKTYRYWIQVRMANPNFGNHKEVAAQQLADTAELDSATAVPTPPVTLPGEIHYYAYDQLQSGVPLKSTKAPGGAEMVRHASDVSAPVQIHRWVNRFTDPTAGGATHVIGDWVVAERLLVKRGDPLGRDLLVEVPEWDERHGKFRLGASAAAAKNKPAPYIPVNFMVEDQPAPLLVDFQGGNHDKYHPQKTTSSLGMKDNAAVELLILDENGKLILRNSHDDAADPLRLQHYTRWSRRLEAVRGASGDGKSRTGGPPGLSGPGIR